MGNKKLKLTYQELLILKMVLDNVDERTFSNYSHTFVFEAIKDKINYLLRNR